MRKEGLADLAVAVGHFRECLRLDKEHADAQHNLELIRLWIKSMESLWEQSDRQKQREEMDLAAFLQMLEEKQRELRCGPRARGRERFAQNPQSARQAEMAERKLGEEIGPLKAKIEATLSKAAQSAPPASGGTTSTGPVAVPEEMSAPSRICNLWLTRPAERSRPRPGNFTPVNRPGPSSRRSKLWRS